MAEQIIQRLQVNQDLRKSEDHQTKMTRNNGFQSQAKTKMKRRKRHNVNPDSVRHPNQTIFTKTSVAHAATDRLYTLF
jgi:hypothetical protein